MIEGGDVIVRIGDLRLFARIDGGSVVDVWTAHASVDENRDPSEVEFAIGRVESGTMMLRGAPGERPRELAGHERMWVIRALRSTALERSAPPVAGGAS